MFFRCWNLDIIIFRTPQPIPPSNVSQRVTWWKRPMNDLSKKSPQRNIDPRVRLIIGYVLFGLGAIVAMPIVQISRSTGRFDDVIALQQLVWLIPFVVLISWLAISTVKTANSTVQFAWAVLLLILIVGFTALMWSQWNRIWIVWDALEFIALNSIISLSGTGYVERERRSQNSANSYLQNFPALEQLLILPSRSL